MPNRALILKDPWASLIISGQKTLEIRTMKTKKIGEEIYIAKAGSKTLIGKVTIDKCIPLSDKECNTLVDQHHATKYLDQIKNKRKYGWFLKNPIAFETPIPYPHPPGAQIWVVLSS